MTKGEQGRVQDRCLMPRAGERTSWAMMICDELTLMNTRFAYGLLERVAASQRD